MKKTFYSALRAMCVGAMTLAVVSCYDDSFLRGEIEGLEGELAGIEARLDSLEKSLNNDVKAINTALGTLQAADEKLAADLAAAVADAKKVNETLSKLDAADGTLDGYVKDLQKGLNEFKTEAEKQLAEALAKIAVVNVEKNSAGNYVLTFANGETLEVSANTDNTGVITTVEVKGVTYWAVVGADGKKTVLDATVHPDTKLAFKVDPDTNELLVAYDGVTYEKTEVIVNDNTTINVVEAFQYTEGAEYVTLTVGGKEYQLPMYEADNSDLTFGRDEVYFAYGASKKLALASEGIAEYYVMSKPDGWKANVEGGKVVVTAPAKELVAMGAGEANGELLLHATTEAGACMVVKVDLVAGPAMKISYNNGEVTFFSALTETSTNWYGDEFTDFVSVWFGMLPMTEFFEYGSFEAYMATSPEYLSSLTNILQNAYQLGYVEGEVEELQATMALTDIIENSWSGFEMEEGVEYVFWAAPQGSTTLLYDQAVYFMTDSYVEVSETESLYNNVNFEATLWGADSYIVGAVNKSQFDEWGISEEFTYEMALQEYLMGSWQPGPLMNFQAGDLTAMGKAYESGNATFALQSLMLPDYGMVPEVMADTEYFVWVLPYNAAKPFADYTFDDLQLTVCKTAPLTFNANVAPTVTIDAVAFDNVAFTVAPPTNGAVAYDMISAEDFEGFKEDGVVAPELIAKSLSNGWLNPESESVEYGSWFGFEPNSTYVVIAYAVVEGEYAVAYEYVNIPEDPANVVATPSQKQWMFQSEALDLMAVGEPMGCEYCFDLGVSFPELYPSTFPDPNTAVIGINYEILGAPAGTWMPAFPACGSYTVQPDSEDETSGVINWLGAEVPYWDFDGEHCKFDISLLLGEEEHGAYVLDCTLATTAVQIQAQ